jgi:hypothetical protein
MIGAQALGKWLTGAGLIEHSTNADAVDMRRFDTKSDDPTRKDIHDDHHPEALQDDGLASKEIDAPQAVPGSGDGREPRRTVAFTSRMMVLCQNPTYHILVDLQTECVQDLLGDARGSRSAD